MKLYRIFSFAFALAFVLSPFMVSDLHAQKGCGREGGQFDCSGGGNCSIDINDFDAEVATELGLNWTVDTQTGTVIVSIVDYKELANALFCSQGLDDPSTTDINFRSRIVVESDDCVNMFPARVCVYIFMKIEHCGETYRLGPLDAVDSREPLVLCSTQLINEFPPPSTQTVDYEVQSDTVFYNENDATDTITIKAGTIMSINSN